MSPLVPLYHGFSLRKLELLLRHGGGLYLRQESLAHQIHASHVCVHGKIPVVLLAVQNGAMVHEAVDGREQPVMRYARKQNDS